MQVIKKAVKPIPTKIPLLYYKTHSQEFEEYLPVEALNNPMYGLRDRIVIDRRWSQRLIDAWAEEKAISYLESIYSGFNFIDSLVLISLEEIKRVLVETIEQIDDPSSKSTFHEFLEDVDRYLVNGKEWLLVNGQHRDDVWHRMWDSEFPLPNIFEGQVFGEMVWNDLQAEEQISALMVLEHPITFYKKMESLDDIEKIIILHNEGCEWNPHEKRSIKASYLMTELTKLGDYSPALKLFGLLGTKGTHYDVKKKGISFLALQMYFQYLYKDKFSKIENIGSENLNSLVSWQNTTWTKNNVDEFVKFFKKIIRELSLYFVGLPKNQSKNIRHKIATLRNYFMFRNVMRGKTNYQPDTYTIANEKNFIAWYVKEETERLLLRNQLTDEGKKLYDVVNNGQPIKNDRVEKDLWNNHRLANAYRYLLNGQSETGQMMVLDAIWGTFQKQFDNGELNHAVSLKGKDVKQSVKDEVRRIAVSKLDGNFTLDDIFALQDKDKTDIGHKDVPKSKGGSNKVGNLFVQDSSWNRSEQDNH
jgi:hypothetical protein